MSQDLPDTPAGAIACNLSPRTGPDGVATPIEITSNTTDPAIAVGKCPVYAVETPDLQRLFVLESRRRHHQRHQRQKQYSRCLYAVRESERTDRHLSSITAAFHGSLTPANAPPNCNIATNPTCGMGPIAGPVYAEYNAATQQLVVANYDGGSISVIDVSLDEYGNDSPTFGTTYTIPVGNTATPNPASVTVLFDGSKAYTANQNDGDGERHGDGRQSFHAHCGKDHHCGRSSAHGCLNAELRIQQRSTSLLPTVPYITIIQSTPTVTDLIDTTVLVEGNVVDLRVTTQNGIERQCPP